MAGDSRPRIYLAGPDVFFPEPRKIAAERKAELAAMGLQGVFPLDNEIEPGATPGETAAVIFKLNRELIENCDAVLANITPFRGVSADTGTVWEIGFACGLGKPVVAYSEDPAIYRDKVERDGWTKAPGDKTDRNGHEIEDFGLVENLMITESVIAICPTFGQAAEKLREFLAR